MQINILMRELFPSQKVVVTSDILFPHPCQKWEDMPPVPNQMTPMLEIELKLNYMVIQKFSYFLNNIKMILAIICQIA